MRLRLFQVFARAMLFFLLSGSISEIVWASTVLKGGQRSAEVSIDYPQRRILIRLIGPFPEGKFPKALEVIYRDAKGEMITFEVSALAPLSVDGPTYQGTLPSYFSILSPSQQPQVGFQVRIPLSRGKSELLH